MSEKTKKKGKSKGKGLLESRVREEIRALTAYSVPRYETRIRLDGNESPFSLPPEVAEDVLSGLRGIGVNRYPDPEAAELRGLISMINGFPQGGILLGNGSRRVQFHRGAGVEHHAGCCLDIQAARRPDDDGHR